VTEQYFSNEIAQAVDALGPTTWSGIAFRHTSPRRNALAGSGAVISGGRWNAPGTSAIYLASPRETCLAEFGRMAEGQGRGASSFLPRVLHTVIVTELVVLNLTTEGAMAAVDLAQEDLSGPWPPCQAVGAAAHFLGLGGVLAPSATGNGVVLAAFETHVMPGQLEVDSTELIDPAELS
jgi:RES domain-containing protein